MKKTVVNQWDPNKGNYYPHQPDKDGRKSYDIRYTLHGVEFKGTLREQPHGARYAYRAEITAISPLTGKSVKDSKGNVVARSFWSNEADLNGLLNGIAKAAEKLYADNAVALSRAVEENVVFRPETTTPAIAAERFAARFEDSLSAKAEKAERASPKYHRKAAIIKEYFAQLPQKPMCEIVSVEIRRLLPFWKLSERNLKLLSGFWDWCIRNKYCTGTNPFPTLTRRTRSPDEKAKAAETPEVLDEADVEKVFHALMDDAVQTAKACAMALQLFGGLNVSQIRALTWGDIIFDDREPDKVIVQLRDDERSGSTHKLDRPIFPMGARILHVRHQSLLQNRTSQSALRGQKVTVRQNGAAIPSGEITRYIIKILKSIKLSAEYYSRKEPGKILRPNELLGSTYRYMVHYTCGLGAMEPGTANYLCGKSLTGNTTDDNYTSFSSAAGLERLYAYMHRLCVPEPLPQGIPPQVSEDGGKETGTFLPKMSRDRVTITATVLLQPGQALTLESAHGGTGIIETEESTPSGRRRRSKKGEKADTI